jgi:RAR-related orphan receptor beta
MSRDAVKFGRMSKKQRDQLYIEVMRHQAAPQQQPDPNEQYLAQYSHISPYMGLPPNYQPHAGSHAAALHSMRHSNFNPNHLHLMQQHLPQTPAMPFPVKHENLQDSYYQPQLNQQQSMPQSAPISPPVQASSPPSIQIPAPRSPPADLTTNILNAFNKTVQLGNHSRDDINMLMSTAPEEVAEIEMSQEEFFIRFATEMSKNIQHIVQFARNIDCFMQLKDTPRTGEADQLNLLKKGSFEILIVQISRCIRNEKILFENQFVDASFFSKLDCDDFFKKFVETAVEISKLELTDDEIALLSAAILMSNNRPGLTEVRMVAQKQTEIINSLRSRITCRATNPIQILQKVSQLLQTITEVVEKHMSMLNKYKQLYPEIITGKKLPLLYTEIFSDQNNNSPQGGVTVETPQTAPLAQSTPPKPTAVKNSPVNSVNQQPESPISSRDSLNTSGSNHEQLSSSSSPTAHLMPPNAMSFPEIGHADFNFAEFPSLIQQSSTDLNLTEKDSSDYGSCKNNFLSSSNSSDASSRSISPQHERKYSSDGESSSPVVLKLEHLESLVDPSNVFSIENSNPYANYFPHFTPSQLNQFTNHPHLPQPQ